MLDYKCIEKLQEYFASGNLEEDFQWSAESRRLEILEFLEKVIELGELADEKASAIIYKGMGMPTGTKQ